MLLSKAVKEHGRKMLAKKSRTLFLVVIATHGMRSCCKNIFKIMWDFWETL